MYVAKSLFLCKFVRPDIQTAMAFLCTRVKSCNKDDCKTLIQLIQFRQGTKEDYLTLGTNTLLNVRWWVDASHTVHPDIKSYTGEALSLSTGVIYRTCKHQNLDTKSSKEVELSRLMMS